MHSVLLWRAITLYCSLMGTKVWSIFDQNHLWATWKYRLNKTKSTDSAIWNCAELIRYVSVALNPGVGWVWYVLDVNVGLEWIWIKVTKRGKRLSTEKQGRQKGSTKQSYSFKWHMTHTHRARSAAAVPLLRYWTVSWLCICWGACVDDGLIARHKEPKDCSDIL